MPNVDPGGQQRPPPSRLIEAAGTLIIEAALWSEKDTFKLAIVGFAAFEQIVDDGIEQVLPRGTPPELKRLNVPTKLALAEALGLITPEIRRLAGDLALIRNKFAHAKMSVLDLPTARQLSQPMHDVFGIPFVAAEAEQSPHGILTNALITAVSAARTSIWAAVAERDQRDAALEAAVRSTPVTSTVNRLLEEAAGEVNEPPPEA